MSTPHRRSTRSRSASIMSVQSESLANGEDTSRRTRGPRKRVTKKPAVTHNLTGIIEEEELGATYINTAASTAYGDGSLARTDELPKAGQSNAPIFTTLLKEIGHKVPSLTLGQKVQLETTNLDELLHTPKPSIESDIDEPESTTGLLDRFSENDHGRLGGQIGSDRSSSLSSLSSSRSQRASVPPRQLPRFERPPRAASNPPPDTRGDGDVSSESEFFEEDKELRSRLHHPTAHVANDILHKIRTVPQSIFVRILHVIGVFFGKLWWVIAGVVSRWKSILALLLGALVVALIVTSAKPLISSLSSVSWPIVSDGSHAHYPHFDSDALVNKISNEVRGVVKGEMNHALSSPLTRHNYFERTGKLNHFAPGNGAIVLSGNYPGGTSNTWHSVFKHKYAETPTGWYKKKLRNIMHKNGGRPNRPATALMPWQDVGQCWCGQKDRRCKSADGQFSSNDCTDIGVKVGEVVSPSEIVIETPSWSATKDIGASPLKMELWARIPIEDQQARPKLKEDERKLFPEAQHEFRLSSEYVKLADLDINIRESKNGLHIAGIPIRLANYNLGSDQFVVRSTETQGDSPYTCIYRVQLHGEIM